MFRVFQFCKDVKPDTFSDNVFFRKKNRNFFKAGSLRNIDGDVNGCVAVGSAAVRIKVENKNRSNDDTKNNNGKIDKLKMKEFYRNNK